MVAIVAIGPVAAIASAVAPSLIDKVGGFIGGLFGGGGDGGGGGGGGLSGLLGSIAPWLLGGATAYQGYQDREQAQKDSAYSRELLGQAINYGEQMSQGQLDRFNQQIAPIQQAYTNAVYQFSDPSNPFSRNPFAGMEAPLFQLGAIQTSGPGQQQPGTMTNPDPSLRPVTEGGNQGTELPTGDKNNYDLRNESGATEGDYSSYDEQMVDIERNAPTYLEPVEGFGGQQFDPTEKTGGSMYLGNYVPPGTTDPMSYIQGQYGQQQPLAPAPNPDQYTNPFAPVDPMLAPINPQPSTGGFAPTTTTAPTGPTPYPPPPTSQPPLLNPINPQGITNPFSYPTY
jgi:hypothetical protein